MPKTLKRTFKYKCLEVLCNTIHRQDKWIDHCKKKHSYKLKNNLEIKHRKVEFKDGSGPWKPWLEPECGSGSNVTVADFDIQLDLVHHLEAKTVITSVEGQSDGVTERAQEYQESSSTSIRASTSQHSSEHIIPGDIEVPIVQQNVLEKQVNSSITSPFPSSQNKIVLDEEQHVNITDNAHHVEGVTSPNPTHFQSFGDFSDPADFANKKLTPEEINLALKLENQNLTNLTFPSTADGRRFNLESKKTKLPNGSTQQRNWLVYSVKKDAIFCLHCTLFALPTERSVWSTTGHRGWIDHRGDRYIDLHEKSKHHLSAQITRLQWMTKKRIDKDLAQQTDKVIEHNREVFSVIIDCCRFLSTEMLAFRKRESLDGKLQNLFRLIAKYNPDARVYLDKLEKAKQDKAKLASNFMSYRNVFDLINVMSDIVVSKIVENINETNAYAVIMDSTQDVSKKECTAVLVRYVDHSGIEGISKVKPQERLITVFTCGDTTGENLSKELLQTLKKFGMDLNGMVGQSMDGAGNMRGKYSGVKSFVLKECPKALYIWCCSHRFALVVEKSMDICPEMRNLFSLLQELYVFMSGHRRHHRFIENLETGVRKNRGKRLKRVQTTRWSSKSEALTTVISCYDIITDTLHDISEDSKSDFETKTSAKGLHKALCDVDTISAMHIASDIFKILSPITVCLQSKNIDYGTIPSVVENTTMKLNKLRSDEEWQGVVSKVTKFTTDHSIEQQAQRRNRKRKRFMDELTIDETPSDPLERMKVNVYFRIIDSLTVQLQDRFTEHSMNVVMQMIHFSHEGLLKLAKNKELLNSIMIADLCMQYNLEEEATTEELGTFTELYKDVYKRIDISDLLTSGSKEDEDELKSDDLAQGDIVNENEDNVFQTGQTQEELDQWIRRGFIRPYRFLVNISGFPHLRTIYRILLSLPATSCSAERTMSRLKIVKNRLRSSMGDSWLSSLLVLSSEKDILQTISNNEIIDKFATTTQHRKKLLLFKSYQ